MSALTHTAHPEDRRLAALHRYRLLDTPSEEALDRITRRTARRLGTPFALLSLVDRDRVFIKSRHGLDLRQLERVPRRRHTPLLPEEVLWVNDGAAYDCFKSLRDFDAAKLIRFYAAAPLVTYDGFILGTLSVMGHEPRDEDPALKRELARLAGAMMREIETRRLRQRLETHEATTRRPPATTSRQSSSARLDRKRPAAPATAAPAKPVTAGTDDLTGLATRHGLFTRLDHELERASRTGARNAVLWVVAIDRFRTINGCHGYAIGDQVLREVARRLERAVPAPALVARLGGDQFAVLASGFSNASDTEQLAAEIQNRLRWPMRLAGHRVSVSSSIGITQVDEHYARSDEILRDGEIAMARAKAAGGARSEMFDPSDHGSSVEQLELETELRGALRREELRLHYQPIIDLASGRLRGFEALARWQHPRHGLLRPKSFIGLAATAGMIPAISKWSLERACHQLADWQRQFPLGSQWTMSINVDSRHLTEPGFADTIDRVLRASGLAPSSLILEVTETAMMSSSPRATAVLHRLKRRGIALHIDDFGTGYATLSYLHRVPGRALKVDASFVTEMLADERHHEIVRSIVGLAHNLGLEVIAEGIETPLHLEALRDLGCDHGQGFYFSRPLDPASLEELLATDTSWSVRHE